MIFQSASQETTGRMLVSTLMSHFASLHVLLITDSISSLFVSVALKQTFYYWCPCYYSWGLQSFWMSLWARNQIVNCRYTELDICDPVDCPSSRRSEFKPPWQNASILLKCPWAKRVNLYWTGPAVLSLTLYLYHSAGGRQTNRWTSLHTQISWILQDNTV